MADPKIKRAGAITTFEEVKGRLRFCVSQYYKK